MMQGFLLFFPLSFGWWLYRVSGGGVEGSDEAAGGSVGLAIHMLITTLLCSARVKGVSNGERSQRESSQWHFSFPPSLFPSFSPSIPSFSHGIRDTGIPPAHTSYSSPAQVCVSACGIQLFIFPLGALRKAGMA